MSFGCSIREARLQDSRMLRSRRVIPFVSAKRDRYWFIPFVTLQCASPDICILNCSKLERLSDMLKKELVGNVMVQCCVVYQNFQKILQNLKIHGGHLKNYLDI